MMTNKAFSSIPAGGGRRNKKWTIFFLVATAVFMSTLDSSIVNVALPVVMKDFKAPLPTIQWVVMAYLLTVSSLLLSFGKLSDIKGRRWVYCRGFFIFTIGSICCGLATGPAWLISARIIQAIGAAMLMACSPALVVDAFPAGERGRALGLVGMVVAAGLTSGPALGGILLNFFSWRVIFYINIPIGLFAVIRAARLLKGGPGDSGRKEAFDWRGSALLAAGFCSFIVLVTHGGQWGAFSRNSLLAGSLSVLCAVLAVRTAQRAENPVFQLELLRERLFIFPVLSLLFLFAALFTVVFLMPFYLVHPAGVSIQRVGYMMMTPFVFLFFISPISGALSDRIGSRWLCTFGIMVLAAALFLLSGLAADASAFSIAWRLALAGIGTAIFISPNSAMAMSAVGSDQRGVASGTIATARNLGMVMGVALAGLIFNSVFSKLSGGHSLAAYGPDLQAPFMAAFRQAMVAGGFVAGVGAVVAFLSGPESTVRE
ncbi:MAG: MFS transporter [Desulfobacterales bacterium]|jgi:EmrB/QacA subfamily drug resistance transporter|nr:MFS transporter [Desulfobacterales bacterium]